MIQSPSPRRTWITFSLLPPPMSTKGRSWAPTWMARGPLGMASSDHEDPPSIAMLARLGGPMFIGLSEEQEQLRRSLRAYYEKLLTPERREALAREHGIGPVTTELRKQMAKD